MAKHDDEFEGRDTVTLTLDDDSELECIVLNIFKGGDREYIALLPTEGIEAEEGTVICIVMKRMSRAIQT